MKKKKTKTQLETIARKFFFILLLNLPVKKIGIETRKAPIEMIRICDVFLINSNDLCVCMQKKQKKNEFID